MTVYIDHPAYMRLRQAVETLALGKGSLGERLENIRVLIVPLQIDKKIFSKAEQSLFDSIMQLYSTYSSTGTHKDGVWQRSLKGLHGNMKKTMAKNITNLFFSIVEKN